MYNLFAQSDKSTPSQPDKKPKPVIGQQHCLRRVMITAGGTGGHIFPGIAVAQILMKKDVNVRWVGTDYGLEKILVPDANIPIHYLPVRGLRGKGVARYLTTPFMVLRSVWQSLGLIKKTQPQVVLSLGGYASAPLALAARLAGVPLIVHEQNAAPGLTNRVLAPMASLILGGLPSTLSQYSQYELMGNPIRSSFTAVYHARKAQFEKKQLESEQLESDRQEADQALSTDITILVVGGSQGAEKLNIAVPKVLKDIMIQNPELSIRVVHQTGPDHLAVTQDRYAQSGIRVDVVTFIDDMAGAYQWAQVVIGRAGALTVSEVAAAGVACIFVPLAIAVDDHQTKNAKTLVDEGAALMVPEPGLFTSTFADTLEKLLLSQESRSRIAQKALSLATIDAAERICERIERLACEDVSTQDDVTTKSK